MLTGIRPIARGSLVAGARSLGAAHGDGRRAEARELRAHGPSPLVVQRVYRLLAAAHLRGDLGRGQTGHVAQHDDAPLVLGQAVERLAQAAPAVRRALLARGLGRRAYVAARDGAARAYMIDRRVAGDLQQPRGERDRPRLVAVDDRHQLEEHVLGDVLRVAVVAHDAAGVAVDAVGVADVEHAYSVAVARPRGVDGSLDER